jgi:hypothetical protein
VTLFLFLIFVGALACAALPELLHGRPGQYATNVRPLGPNAAAAGCDPDGTQWITHDPADAL